MYLYTPQELDQEIALYKEAIRAIAEARDYTIGTRRVTRVDLPQLRTHLEWLHAQKLAAAGLGGPVMRPGRVAR